MWEAWTSERDLSARDDRGAERIWCASSNAEVCLTDSGAEADERRPRSFHLIHKTSATVSGAAVVFKKGKDVLIHRDGTKFHAYVHE